MAPFQILPLSTLFKSLYEREIARTITVLSSGSKLGLAFNTVVNCIHINMVS